MSFDHALDVSEIFGPTIQGEGPSVGRPAVFLRLSGCNLHCTWCDTPYTWDWTRYDRASEVKKLGTVEVAREIQERLGDMHPPLLVISGGEPLLQQHGITHLLALLPKFPLRVEIETNGTIFRKIDRPDDQNVAYNVSPKLPHAEAGENVSVGEVLDFWLEEETARFKFVCQTAEDVDAIAAVATRVGVERARVWIMPEGRSVDELDARAPILGRQAVKHGFNFTDRAHLRIWGNQRGH